MTDLPALPDELVSILDISSVRPQPKGRLGSTHFRVTLKDGTNGFLKLGQPADEIQAEANRLLWLNGRAGAPRVLLNTNNGDAAFLLMSEMRGRPAHECLSSEDPLDVIHAAAMSLRAVHVIPIGNCPFSHVIDRELESAEHRLTLGLVDAPKFTRAVNQSPEDALAELRSAAQFIPATHVTHGDFALPNIILDHDLPSGVVDWSQAGISNPNRDFMCIEKSIARNCSDKDTQYLINEFYQHYEIAQPDREQIQFFWKLDQFWVQSL